jgi:hypothetical protein
MMFLLYILLTTYKFAINGPCFSNTISGPCILIIALTAYILVLLLVALVF